MISPGEFVEKYCAIGRAKTENSALRLFLLGILAGFYIGIGGAISSIVSCTVENAGVGRMVSGLLFPFGLIMVILTGAELFTGNCLITIPVLCRRVRLSGMARNLVIVYLGNFVGSLALAAAGVSCGLLDLCGGALASSMLRTAAAKCALSLPQALLRGILCNILVCAAVMFALCGKDIPGKAVGAYIPIACFVICGFEHCVANMYYVPMGLLAGGDIRYSALVASLGADLPSWGAFLLKNLLPVTVGNLIGGCAFSAAVAYSFRADQALLKK